VRLWYWIITGSWTAYVGAPALSEGRDRPVAGTGIALSTGNPALGIAVTRVILQGVPDALKCRFAGWQRHFACSGGMTARMRPGLACSRESKCAASGDSRNFCRSGSSISGLETDATVGRAAS
jgi:hypothetical protein